MRFFCILPVLLCLAEAGASEELFISGVNQLEYWRWRETKEEFFEDKLDIEAIYGDFLGGLRYHVLRPSQVDDGRSRQGFSRYFLEYSRGPFSARGGTYYSVIGRGLLLAAYEDEQVKLDQDLEGFKASLLLPKVDFTLLSGRPRTTFDYSIINDTTDLIRGADVNLRPLSLFNLGAGYVRLNQLDQMPPPPDTSRMTELYGGRGEFIWNWINLYGEYGKKKGWDRNLFAEGEGEGYYLSSSLSLSGLGLSAEYCDYDSLAYGGFTYRYNNPPVPNRYGKAIDNGVDEKGYQVSAAFTPWGPLLAEGAYAELKTHDDTSHTIREVYGESKLESFEIGALKLSVDRLEEVIRGIFSIEEIETTRLLEGHYHVGSTHTLGGSYRHRMLCEETQVETKEWVERRASVSYSYVPRLTLTLTGEDTSQDLSPEEDTSWLSGTLELRLGEFHDLSLTVGSQKGEELICSGGVCRTEPPFEGWKVLLSSRF